MVSGDGSKVIVDADAVSGETYSILGYARNGNLLLMKLLVGYFGLHYAVANILAIGVCSVLNFFAGERLVFTTAR